MVQDSLDAASSYLRDRVRQAQNRAAEQREALAPVERVQHLLDVDQALKVVAAKALLERLDDLLACACLGRRECLARLRTAAGVAARQRDRTAGHEHHERVLAWRCSGRV
jgi:hypothetical protein